MARKEYNLEERLLDQAAAIIKLTEHMVKTKAGVHVGGQLLRSGTSPYFNHGEAQAAESPRDFIHKMGVCLKELRESILVASGGLFYDGPVHFAHLPCVRGQPSCDVRRPRTGMRFSRVVFVIIGSRRGGGKK